MNTLIRIFLAAALALSLTAAPATAQSNDGVCPALSTGHLHDAAGPSITVYAPAGTHFTAYCVKAGSANQGDGPVLVTLSEPVTVLTISHPSGKDISHYSLTKEPVPSEPTPTPTVSPTPTPEPSPTPEPTPTSTPRPTPQPTPSATVTPKPTPEPTATPQPSPTPPPVPKVTPSPQPSPTPTPTPGGTCDWPDCLARTGSSSGLTAGFAGALILFGGAAVAISRRLK